MVDIPESEKLKKEIEQSIAEKYDLLKEIDPANQKPDYNKKQNIKQAYLQINKDSIGKKQNKFFAFVKMVFMSLFLGALHGIAFFCTFFILFFALFVVLQILQIPILKDFLRYILSILYKF